MKRLLLAFALLFAAAPVLPAADVAPLPRHLNVEAQAPKDSQVLIGYESNPGPKGAVSYWYGTGSAIAYEDGSTLFLTNSHVAPYSDGNYYVYYKGEKHKAIWLAAMKMTDTPYLRPDGTWGIQRSFENNVDLAVISAKIKVPTVRIAEDNAPVGARLFQWGFSGFKDENAGPPNNKTGLVTQSTDEKHTTSDLPSAPGDSGSGLFNEKNERVAVTAWGNAAVVNVRTIAMSAKTVRKFLIDKSVKKWFPKFGARLAEVVPMPK